MKKVFAILVSLLLISNISLAATCNSLSNGDWNEPSTWSCGLVPTAGSTITISVGDTVTVSSVINVIGPAVTIIIHGALLFNTLNSRILLPCNSVVMISPTGSVQSTGGHQATHGIRICRDFVWVGTDGILTGPVIFGTPLPIELAYFDAEANGSDIDFSWQTATEKDNDFFTIEGSSDGMNWSAMHRIEGAGTTQEVQDYSLASSNYDQFEYFRLKQTDFDGNFSYSDIVAVPVVSDELVVYPNPSNGRELTINLSSNDSGILQILHSDGRIAHSMELTGEKVIRLDGLNLKAGAYILQIQQLDQIEAKRLIVQ